MLGFSLVHWLHRTYVLGTVRSGFILGLNSPSVTFSSHNHDRQLVFQNRQWRRPNNSRSFWDIRVMSGAGAHFLCVDLLQQCVPH